MQIGYDFKSDSTKNLMPGIRIPMVLDETKSKGDELSLFDMVFGGFNKILRIRAGGSTPVIDCARRGIITAIEKLEESNAYNI